MRRRPLVLAVLLLVIGFVAGGALTAVGATPNDSACRKGLSSTKKPSDADLLTYDACRFDKLDAAVAGLRTSATAGPTASSTPGSSSSPTPTPAPTTSGTLDLPQKPYAGGPSFWAQFPAAKAAGWDRSDMFPILVWYGSCSPEQYAFDKAHGINTYAQCNPDTPHADLKAAGLDTLFTAKGQPSASVTTQPGVLLDDEVDGRYSDSEGVAHLKQLDAQHGVQGRFSYANYTSGIVTYDRSMANSSAYLNGTFNDVIGLDQYFYSNPQCSWTDPDQAFRFRTPAGQNPIDRSSCRTSSSYGKAQQLLQEVDASDGKVDKAILAFVEVVAPGGGSQNGGTYVQPTGAQIRAAAWHSVIGGAAGVDWFTNSPDGGSANPCLSGDVLADARLGRGCSAVAPNVEAMGRTNRELLAMAPVLNAPTLRWDFGSGIDSMLKVKDGSAYVFAMTKDGGTGPRTFTLPNGIAAGTVEVVGENRALPVSSGRFTDAFPAESDVHTYRIAL